MPAIYDEARKAFFVRQLESAAELSGAALQRVARIGEPFYAGKFEAVVRQLREAQARSSGTEEAS